VCCLGQERPADEESSDDHCCDVGPAKTVTLNDIRAVILQPRANPVNVKLTPELEQIINDELSAGHFRTAEEVVAQALQKLRQQHPQESRKPNVAQEMAVKEMLAFVEKNHVQLSGLSVKELIHEGHRL
jgi:Arc/MetJ-type ribon-helix-helix transcriptional regulator